MDFHNIAHALGKQTKKVKDMASKPIDLVATPISNLHKKIKKTVFGPDLTIFITVLHQQQLGVLHRKYVDHMKQMGATLQKEKFSLKKSKALLASLAYIRELADKQIDLQDRIDLVLDLLEELRHTCGHGVPSKWEKGICTYDKKVSYTKDEYTLVDQQLLALSSLIKSLGKSLEDDMYQTLLEHTPSSKELTQKMDVMKKDLPISQKQLQKDYRTVLDQFIAGKSIMKQFTKKEHEFEILQAQEKSLFSTEKTKSKHIRLQLEKELKLLIRTAFMPRQKKVFAQLQTIKKQRACVYDITQHPDHIRHDFFNERKLWFKQLAKTANQQQKQEPESIRSLLKQTKTTTQGVKQLFNALQGSTTDKQIDGLIKQYHQVEHMGNKQRIAVATAYRKTGMHTQLPLVAQQLLIDHREHYLIDRVSLLRDQILAARMYKRLLQKQITLVRDMIQSMQSSSLPKEFTAVKDTMNLLLKDLQASISKTQQDLDKAKSTLSNAKSELWDTITRRRLVARKRHRYQEFTAAHLADGYAGQLVSLVELKQMGIKILKQKEKELNIRYHVKQAALHDHQKTLQVVKKRNTQQTAHKLDKELQSLKDLMHTLHELTDHLKLQKDETGQLVKKYEDYAAHTIRQLSIQEKYIVSIATKLKRSSLQQRVDCKGIKK